MRKLLLLTFALLVLQVVQAQEKATIKDGDKCPAFEMTDINGKKYTLKEFKGYYIYFDFWATW